LATETPKERDMFQWWSAQEQLELWREDTKALTEFERQRLEFLEELAAEKPSLFQRVLGLFRAEPAGPEPYMPRSMAEAELVGAGVCERMAR
jgi:hypothetical protein